MAWKINDEKKNKDDEVLVIDVAIIMKILDHHMVPEKGHAKLVTMIWHPSKYTPPIVIVFFVLFQKEFFFLIFQTKIPKFI